MDRKLSPFPATMTMLAFLCFAALYILFTAFSVIPEYGRALLFGIPFLVLLCITVLAYSGKLGRTAANILTALLSLLFVAGVFCLLVYMALSSGRTDDTRYYERVLSRCAVDELCPGLLPDTIPADAENLDFHYWPAVLQGGEGFVLSFGTDGTSLDAYEEKLRQNALWTGTHAEALEQDIPVQTHYTLPDHYGPIPDEYTLYLISADPMYVGANHGLSYTVTVNRSTGQIFFFYEDW